MDVDEKNVEARRSEFFSNVWNHQGDPFQAQFDVRRRLSPDEMSALGALVDAIRRGDDDGSLSALVANLVQRVHGDFLALLLQLTGSTRSKILTDLRSQASARNIRIPSSHTRLVNDSRTWGSLAGPYVVSRLRNVLTPLLDAGVEGALEALNQATYPGYVRQERAKRQGHEAETRLAAVLTACEIPFVPEEKAINGMCPDVQVHGISFDLVVPHLCSPQVCVKATVHTANIGQYGESKDHLEVAQAMTMLTREFGPARPLLLALIDGIGFRSNRAGLDGVLSTTDEFCQFQTLWKAVVVCASRLEMKPRIELPSEEIQLHSQFLQRYGFAALVYPIGALDLEAPIEAGNARIERP